MYGIDSYVLPPPLGALMSVILASGCDGVGLAVLRTLGFCSAGAPLWHRWQAPIVGAMLLALVLYPLALINLTPLIFVRAVAVFVGLIGLVNGVAVVRGWSQWRTTLPEDLGGRLRIWSLLLILLVVGAAAMSLGPPTDADSLDYHL